MKKRPIALTIAGSDSGGGAGIQADLKAFAALGAHGVSAITCLTAQNPAGVKGVQAASPALVRQQLEAIFSELPPRAAKTGMLFSAEIIREVAKFWRRGARPALVVDPVMVATSGARLLRPDAVAALTRSLLPLADLITPNLAEAEVLTDLTLRHPADLVAAARRLAVRYGCAVLVKGGHLPDAAEAVDAFCDRNAKTEVLLSTPFVRGVSTHGTGCTYSAAITAYLAQGRKLPEAVARAKDYIYGAIAQSHAAGRHSVLNWFWQQDRPASPT